MTIYQTLIGTILGVAAAVAYNARRKEEEKLAVGSIKPGRKTCLIEPLALPATLALCFALLLIAGGPGALKLIYPNLGLLVIHISLYYALLLLLLVPLRRIISAGACAALWLLPTLLYFFVWISGHEMRPVFVITLPRRLLPALTAVWAAGFITVMLWQLVSHLRIRGRILRGATELENEAVLVKWKNGLRRHGIKTDIPIAESTAVSTPLTVGCFTRTMRLVLPRSGYTDRELDMIFRHELRHILRCDTRTKLFLAFYTAMCWFNPLAWIARRKVAADLELSCDEAILSGADDNTRKEYAKLLLMSAGDGRGCTTCLSAAPGTLRYRLRNVVKPAKRLPGGVFISVALFVLISAYGAVGLADGSKSVQTLIFDRAPPAIVIDRVVAYNGTGRSSGYRTIHGYDGAALTGYISSLRARQVYAGNYEEGNERRLYVDYAEAVDGNTVSLTRIALGGGLIFADIPYDDSREITYIIDGAVDWEYIDSLLDYDAPDPDPAPEPPKMLVYLSGPEHSEAEPLYAQSRVLSVTDAAGRREPEYEYSGVGGGFGAMLTEARLGFSYPPSEFSVTVENWDRSARFTLSSAELDGMVLPLTPYSAHYTVRGSFDTVRDTHYEMEFYFDIGQPADEELWRTY